ncbi:DUF58 domain-containing protein [Naasia lichenicola]|uniref:DUF58 domain-containing protein n=1 Tax=Naasia lichenicola TaxID=2565933 RepID=A0A4V3WTL8_9MICO|nr:DUF58 domain-containing protein [Naasia lichenicola]THG32407.1 DUF58 domain-containing protein [Naasia lichenicola]
MTGTRSRAAGIPSSTTQLRADIVGPAATEGLRNERTRLVGTRTGLGADALITLVRLWRAVSGAALRAARQVSAVVTPLGWTMLSVVVVAFLVGYGFGWAELAAVAWAGAVIIVVASLFLIGGHSQGIELTMAHPRVVVGDRAVGGITAVNPTRRRLLGTTLEIPVGRGLLEFPLPSIAPGATIDDVFVVPTTRRGLITIGPVRSVRADPIGLVRREHIWPGSIELFVHPQTVSIPSTSTGFVRDLEGQATRDLTSSDVAFNALRDYQLGDDRRWIHWKSTAKTGVYMVKQFEETRRSHLMVALSLAGDDYADDEQFELAVSVAGSLGVRAIRDARTVSVVVSERTPEFAKRKTFAVRSLSTITRTRLLDELAVIDRATAALGVVDLARVAAEQVAGTSVAFVVLGSTATPLQLRAVSSAFPSGVEVIAVLCDPGYTPSLRRVSDLTVLTIGYLEDLQKSLARSQAA